MRFCWGKIAEEMVIVDCKTCARRVAVGGIQFLPDEKGTKTAAVIDLDVHKAL